MKQLPDYLSIRLRRIRPFREGLRYGYAVGRIRANELKLLRSHHIRRMLEADFEEALHILDEVELGDYLTGASTAREVDDGLIAYLKDVYAFLEGALPADSVLLEFFRCRYDFHNLKVLVKARMGDASEDALLPGLGRWDTEIFRRGLDNPLELPSPYREAVMELGEGSRPPNEIDSILDRHFLIYRLRLAEREGSDFMVEFARTSIDFSNLKLLLRSRKMGKAREYVRPFLVEGGFIPVGLLLEAYGDPDDVMMAKLERTRYSTRLLHIMEEDEKLGLNEFDRRSDDYIMEMLKATRRISLGVEPVFSFVRARENEVTQVRIILMGKLHNLAPEAIEKMLRKLYLD